VSRARQHLQGFLLRHGRKHGRGTAWRMAYRRWLSTLAFEHPAQQIAFQDYVDAVMDAERRLQRVEEQISGLLPKWNLRPVVDALQAMRGIALITAVVLVAEVGDFTRFANPRQLMGDGTFRDLRKSVRPRGPPTSTRSSSSQVAATAKAVPSR
jgi:transposase